MPVVLRAALLGLGSALDFPMVPAECSAETERSVAQKNRPVKVVLADDAGGCEREAHHRPVDLDRPNDVATL